jgi:Carbohydrate/starch-binding module (family 21)
MTTTNPVEFRLVLSNSFPTGTGSFGYEGSFEIVVENLAFVKQVSILARVGTNWRDINANFVESLPENSELWRAPANNSEDEFVAKYTVNGLTFFDNNVGANYKFPKAFDDFVALSGIHYKVVLGSAFSFGGTLHISAGVQNLAFEKVVGAVFTTDDFATVHTAFGNFERTMSSGLEVWTINAPVDAFTPVTFALFYRVLGQEFWDNNFWRNYTVTPTVTPGPSISSFA